MTCLDCEAEGDEVLDIVILCIGDLEIDIASLKNIDQFTYCCHFVTVLLLV